MRMELKIKSNARYVLYLALLFFNTSVFSQGKSSVYLLGYNAKARIDYTTTSFNISPDTRQITFNDTQGNISDENGNLLMSSNGVFIADANGDTMLNGSGLNPGWGVNNCPDGLCIPYGNLFIPFPADSDKYILFHQSVDIATGNSPQIFYSIVDITLNGGLGEVISKNNIAASGSFGGGLTACKHGNGRDWWLTAVSIDGDLLHQFLVTPDTIQYIGMQNLGLQAYNGYGGQATFSPNGEKFALRNGYLSGFYWNHYINLLSFDRCSGLFNLDTVINYSDSTLGWGTMFSPDSKYLYFSTSEHIYQINTDTINVASSFQVVAINDTFASPNPPLFTNFYLMYLAANGKIYISSGSSVKHLHEINYPDSAGLACDVQLHNIFTNCFYIGVPNHPNYYLGRKIGSPCDSLTSISDLTQHDFRFSISPNPTNGNFKIIYLLPQNKSGTLQIIDITGKEVYKQNLPQWSTLQNISLPKLANGVYNCSITSGSIRVQSKLVIVR